MGYVNLSEGQTSTECSNPACDSQPRICPRCRDGIITLRTGRSTFWSRSRYTAAPTCVHMERASDQYVSNATPVGGPAVRSRGGRASYNSHR